MAMASMTVWLNFVNVINIAIIVNLERMKHVHVCDGGWPT